MPAVPYGWVWIDAIVGIIGALVIAHWSWGLIRSSGAVLLDAVPSQSLAATVRQRLEVEGDRVSDLHLWRLGPGHIAVVAGIVTDRPRHPDFYKARLSGLDNLSHVIVEILPCTGH